MMGDFGYIFGYALILAFLLGVITSVLLLRARYWRALRHKPKAIAKYIKTLEQIIVDWKGSDEELEALIMLENMVLYHI